MTTKQPLTEAEFFERESRLAREALSALGGELAQSLGRSADASAWTRRYPWASLAAAATGGVAAGWAAGGLSRKSPSADARHERNGEHQSPVAESVDRAATHPAGRLVHGLGVLLSAAMSAVAVAATQALTEIVKSSIHEAMHPDSGEQPS